MTGDAAPVEAARVVVFDEDGRLLLLHTLDLTPRPGQPAGLDWWELPGGKLEPGETPEQAALREL